MHRIPVCAALFFALFHFLSPASHAAAITDKFTLVLRQDGEISTNRATILPPVSLPAGRYLLAASQKNIDLQLSVSTPFADTVKVNTLSEHLGHEYLAFETTGDGEANITVLAEEQTGVNGAYELRLYSLSASTNEAFAAFVQLTHAGALGAEQSEAARFKTIDHLKQALSFFEDKDDHYLTGMIQYQLGYNYYWPLLISESESHYLAAVAQFEKLDDPVLVAASKIALAATIMEEKRFEEANTLYRQSIDVLTAKNQEHLAATAINLQGLMAYYRNRYDLAERLYLQAGTIFTRLGDRARLAQVIDNLALIEQERANLLAARDLHNLSLETLPTGEQGWLEAIFTTNLASAELKLGNADRALGLLDEVEKFQQKIGNPADLAWTYNGIADIYRSLNDINRAVTYQEQSATIRRTHPESGGLYDALLRLADDYRVLSEKTDKDQRLKSALRYYVEALNEAANDKQKANVLFGLAQAHFASGDEAKANSVLRNALNLAAGANEEELVNVIRLELAKSRLITLQEQKALATSANNYFASRVTSSNKAHSFYALAKLATSRKEAIALNNKALETLDDLRQKIANPWLSIRMTKLEYPIAEFQIGLLLGQTPATESIENAFDLARRYRAKSMRTLLYEIRDDIDGTVAADLLAQRKNAYEQFHQALAQHTAARDSGDPQLIKKKTEELNKSLTQIDIARSSIRSANPDYALADPGDLPSVGEIQKWMRGYLPPGSIVLFYFVGLQHSYGWAISREHIVSWLIPEQEVLQKQVNQLLKRIASPAETPSLDLYRSLSGLGQTLIPDTIDFSTTKHLIVIPDGPLGNLPFNALLVERDKKRQYLLERAQIEHVPSLALAMEKKPREHSTTTPSLAIVTGNSDLGNLQGAKHEARVIADRWTHKVEQVAVDTNLPFTSLQKSIADHSLVHFATHAWVNSVQPQLSGIALSDHAQQPVSLTLADLFRLKLNAELVFLNACETAVGEQIQGEGAMSLVRGFQFAGADSVVATRWKIADRFSSQFASQFYEEIQASQTSFAESLRATQLRALRENPTTRHPYYWGSYAITGTRL